jgi:hypothetical protein
MKDELLHPFYISPLKTSAHDGHFSGRIIFETAQQGQSRTSTNAQNKGKDK